MCSWEQVEDDEILTLRRRLAVMSERLWNPDHVKGLGELTPRLDVTDSKLSEILGE
jgi:hypothetical protein